MDLSMLIRYYLRVGNMYWNISYSQYFRYSC